jgi:hypothetical protein
VLAVGGAYTTGEQRAEQVVAFDAVIACRDTSAMLATCCWENPRACRATRSRAPLPAGYPSLTLALP